ncbi:MAG TPA: GNAT family N-acetyltransferase [Sphingomicrobium sp.]|nr:GNAT family N-acetyltransferase [Sphingomicrobium sp.]
MSDLLEALVAAGKRVKRSDPNYALSHYIEHPHRLHCFLAINDKAEVLGFQSLKIADEGNPYGTPTGWGIIGTHVRPSAARLGVGSQLFVATRAGASTARLPAIEAYIGDQNSAALNYYEAMGFTTYRRSEGIICKVFQLTNEASSLSPSS